MDSIEYPGLAWAYTFAPRGRNKEEVKDKAILRILGMRHPTFRKSESDDTPMYEDLINKYKKNYDITEDDISNRREELQEMDRIKHEGAGFKRKTRKLRSKKRKNKRLKSRKRQRRHR